ncbi:MAG: hypothetical protein KIT11_01680 [Fimbriimonadaceae bacterium]|nr:hypothetical protein [Fimbriimonadaceae bacterium]QYK54919.1 MAG: hypothetical protein KF733_07855 [Fimbriimonadaceae bacterium]
MALIAKIVSFLTSLAAIIASVEAIIRLARFAWALILRLIQTRQFAGGFATVLC